MAPRLRWPFSMDVFYRTHGLANDVPYPPEVKSSQHTQQYRPRRTFHWPFSLEVFYTTHGLNYDPTMSISEEKQKTLSESESGDEETLADRITDSFVESCFDTMTRLFAPASSLESLITPSTIAHELRLQTTPDAAEDARLIEYICSNAVKIFATVIFIEPGKKARKTMLLCVEHNITDRDLPFMPDSTGDKWGPARRVWSKSYNLKFCEAQWRFTAPVLSDMVELLSFAPECILPVTRKGTARSGAFSNVEQAFIHQGHLQRSRAPGSESHSVAIKTIRLRGMDTDPEPRQAWAREVEALNRLARLQHPHIVDIITSFSKGDQRCVMLEWADGGSLADIWKTQRRPLLTRSTCQETCAQLHGLVDAIACAHSNHFRHGDLKPANILAFLDGTATGRLKIGDWGMAKTHITRTAERFNATSARYGTLLYEPPEAVGRLGPRSRLYDVWSLGCVFLEHMVWLIYGEDERVKFVSHLQQDQAMHTFYEYERGKASVAIGAVRWMDHILEQFPEGTIVGDVVSIIKTRMLVLELPVFEPMAHKVPASDTSGSGPPTIFIEAEPSVEPAVETGQLYRATAVEVAASLDKVLRNISQNAEYGLPDTAHGGPSTPDRRRHIEEFGTSHQEVDPLPRRQVDMPFAQARSTREVTESSSQRQETDEPLPPSVPIPIVRQGDPSGLYRKWGVDKDGNPMTYFTPDPVGEEDKRMEPAHPSRSFTIRAGEGLMRL